MSRKTVLIVNPSALYPILGMNQVRVINQIKSLSINHDVILLFLYKNKKEQSETNIKLTPFCHKILPIKTLSQSFIFRVAKKLFLKKILKICMISSDYFTLSNSISARQIARIVNSTAYDVLITHYWQSAGFFKYLKRAQSKCSIDTHYAVEENIELFEDGKYNHFASSNMGRELQKDLFLQKKYFKLSDFLIVNSQRQQDLIRLSFPELPILVVPNGQDLSPFLDFDKKNIKIEKNILFYGALSNQFNNRALERIVFKILPEIRKIYPNISLIALGSSPPAWLIKESEKKHIEVTGFVEDIRPILAASYLTLIPLDSAAGFRGRTVELMAMGVPIIGTHNALDCVGATDGLDMFVVDSNEEIISTSIELLNDRKRRDLMAKNASLFANENYSLNATFGVLSKHFLNI